MHLFQKFISINHHPSLLCSIAKNAKSTCLYWKHPKTYIDAREIKQWTAKTGHLDSVGACHMITFEILDTTATKHTWLPSLTTDNTVQQLLRKQCIKILDANLGFHWECDSQPNDTIYSTVPSGLSSETFICCSLLARACFNESLTFILRRVNGSSADGRSSGACIGFTTTGLTSTFCTQKSITHQQQQLVSRYISKAPDENHKCCSRQTNGILAVLLMLRMSNMNLGLHQVTAINSMQAFNQTVMHTHTHTGLLISHVSIASKLN